MAKILCVSNQKGGVGKTTTTNALAMGLRRLGRRVLCVDFDPQGDLSFGLRADNRVEMQNSIYHALKGELLAVQTIQHTPFCDVIPANMLLSGIELEFTGQGVEEKGIDRATGKVLVEVSPDFYRPTDVVDLWGDPSKAKRELGWNPAKTSFEDLVRIMTEHDMERIRKESM